MDWSDENARYFFLAIIPLMILAFYNSFLGPNTGIYNSGLIVHLHVISIAIWFLFFFLQVYLAIKGNLKLHRTFGKLSYALVPVVFVTAIMASTYSYYNHPVPENLKSITVKRLYYNYYFAVIFLVLYILAIANRKKVQIHYRYMVSLALIFVGAAIYRVNYYFLHLDFMNSLDQSSLRCVFIVNDLILFFFIVYDVVFKRPYRPYVIALVVFLIGQMFYVSFNNTRIWQSVVERY